MPQLAGHEGTQSQIVLSRSMTLAKTKLWIELNLNPFTVGVHLNETLKVEILVAF